MPKWWNIVRNAAKNTLVNKFTAFPLATIISFLILQFDCIQSSDGILQQTNNWRWNQGNSNMKQNTILGMSAPPEVSVNFLPLPPAQNSFGNWQGGRGDEEKELSPILGEDFWTARYSKPRQNHLTQNYRGRIPNRSYVGASPRAPKRKRVRWRGLLGSTEESEEKGSSNEYGATREEFNRVDDGDCSLYPNNTFNAPFAYACETRDEATGLAPPTIVVHEAAFANETGDYVYPLDFAQTLRIFLDVTSYATRRYDNMRAEVLLYRRKTGWMGCGWSVVPTFGTLDSLEICEENNPSCPVYPGRQVLEMKMEPNPVISGILRMFYDDRVPYQMRVRVLNNRRRGEELFCVVFQARIEI